MEKLSSTLNLESFSELSDPRASNARHLLNEIFFIAICAVLSGSESWEDIELYGKSKYSWLKEFLQLPHGIPSNDTFRRVFTAIDPEKFEACFQTWVCSLAKNLGLDVIPIDGKTLRHSFDQASNQSAIHMVSAWSVAHQLVLGQVKVDGKSNEITAIPQLLEMLDIRGCIVTTDALGTQKKISEQIIDQEGDYVQALKENHPKLYQQVQNYLNTHKAQIQDSPFFYETIDAGHGRVEIRKYYITSDIDWIEDKPLWKKLTSIGMVESIREEKDKTSTETRYYINSITADPVRFAWAVRNHWGIENSLHWVLDVSFQEDDSRIRNGNAPQNFALLRKIALNILKRDQSKGSLKGKRKKAGWDNQFLMELLNQANFK